MTDRLTKGQKRKLRRYNKKKAKTSKWAKGYYCRTAGHVSQEQVIRYIAEQEGSQPFNYDIKQGDVKHPDGQTSLDKFRGGDINGNL